MNGVGQLGKTDSDKLTDPITLEEVEESIKQSASNKSPGLDGLTAEFYKTLSDFIAPELVSVFNDQLQRKQIIESNRHGATRLISKVKGIPLVTELRPITLLNQDYKILTRILSKRLTSVLGTVCKSVQSCSVPGVSICTSASNLISTIEGVVRNNSTAALLSLDMFKAYDRVNLRYLEKVMESMKIPKEFIEWILALHHNADTCLLLTFTTRFIPILFSIRQGDPLAMTLFLLYIEPLLLRLQEVSSGVILQARLVNSVKAPLIDDVKEKLDGYVDDTEVMCSKDEDFIAVDKCVGRFEKLSGAILNRSKKSIVLGLGAWKERTSWPLSWLKTVTETTVFGFILHNDYSEILERNWASQFAKFRNSLFSGYQG